MRDMRCERSGDMKHEGYAILAKGAQTESVGRDRATDITSRLTKEIPGIQISEDPGFWDSGVLEI